MMYDINYVILITLVLAIIWFRVQLTLNLASGN